MTAIQLQREELASWLQDASLKPHVDYMIVDVRDADFANGNIATAVNIPAHELNANPFEHQPLLSVPKRLIFHCLLSQVRGPKSANTYLRSVGAAEGQQVFVLVGGFSNWQEKYGKDKNLTKNYNAKFWANGGYEY
ncbi:UNVERIFIED_CONTAM: hypothetical protein HDU68_012115 [Siphonaria sp. JEL0065]|nr:hypothetical protein HDU68_012115 [Siphonaria sp. JEL0065]